MQNTRSRRNRILAVIAIAVIGWLLWLRGCQATPPVTVKVPDEIDAIFGSIEELPYDGKPIVPYTPPASPVPEAKAIFPEVVVRLNQRTLKPNEPLTFRAGESVEVELEAPRNPKLPNSAAMSASGLGLACKADNSVGWMIIDDQFFGAQSRSYPHRSYSKGTWKVPDLPGEFTHVVLGDATVDLPKVIPIRLVESFPLKIEKR